MEETTQQQLYEWYTTANKWGHYYYDVGDSLVPDEVYDELMQKIKRTEAEHPEWMREDSPTQHVGGMEQASGFGKVKHPEPMQSLKDVFSKEEVESWYNSVMKVIGK